ncbi:MAG TPA: alpha/beta hydrolase, partial [Anaerolineales bacterium]|nr:alpha/beta hydrolase [Anaerolineales bacterium]
MSTRPLALDTKPQNSSFRWIRNSLLVIFIIMVGPILGGLYQSFSSAQDARTYPPPGQLIEMGGFKMHLYCLGERKEGVPTVILFASYPATVSSWVWIQPQLATLTRVCAYDRTGEGWSDLSPEVPTFRQMTEELTLLLEKAGEPGPYVLVGH